MLDEVVSCEANPNGWFTSSTIVVISTQAHQFQLSSIEKDKIASAIKQVERNYLKIMNKKN